jgi:hypothetical protein
VAVAVAAITVAVPISVPVSISIPIPIPEYATIIVVIAEEAAGAAEAVVTISAAYALDLLDDAQLVARRRNVRRAGESDRVGTPGQQRGADESCGGGQRHQQELVHFSSSSLSAVMAWKSRFSKSKKMPPIDFGSFGSRDQIAGTSLWRRDEQALKEQTRPPGNTSSALSGGAMHQV